MEKGKRMEVKEESHRTAGNLPNLNPRKLLELAIFGKYFEKRIQGVLIESNSCQTNLI